MGFYMDTWDSRSPLLDLLVGKQHGKFPKMLGSSWKILSQLSSDGFLGKT